MGRASPIQNAVNAGELSPYVYSRSDIQKYARGARTLLNWLPLVQGPSQRRSGTKFVKEVKTSANKTRIVPFEFSVTQAYIIEFGNTYLRFYKDRGNIESGGSPYEVSTSYATADLFQLYFAQSADVLYVFHNSYKPTKITRTAHTSWTVTEIDFQDGPYLPTNTETTTLTPSATTGNGITVTASATTGINGGDGFKSTDVGRLIRLKHTTWGWVEITGFTSTTVVTADVKGTLGGTTATTDWRLGVWSDTTGWPACGIFYEDRLWMAGPTDNPQRVDGSRSGDYEDFAPSDSDETVADDHGVSFTLNANQVNAIRWMADQERGLAIGTTGGEWILRPSSSVEAITPTNVKANKSTALGSAQVQPVIGPESVLFVQRSGRKVRELAYVFERDGFSAPDMTILAEHVTKGGITELTFAREPQPILWAARTDGVLLGMTYDREQNVIGWHRHILGGVGDVSGGDPVVESVAVIPTPTGDASELWMVVKRYIDGATVRYIEYLMPVFDHEDDQEDAFFVDCGLTYDGASTTSISGLDHLEGETVTILADGATHPDETVTSGAITLDRAASKVHIGYDYNSDFEPLNPEAGSSDGTSQGKKRRINRVIVSVYRTLGLELGPDSSNLHRHKLMGRSASDDLGAAVPLYTGEIEESWDSKHTTDAVMFFRQNQPLPATIRAVMPHIVTENRQ